MGSQAVSSSPIRLAILMCDFPMPGTAAKYKDYGGVFTDLFTRAVAPSPLGSVLSITTHNVLTDDPASYPDVDDVDAILLTGSKFSAHDRDPWIDRLIEYTQKAISSNRVRVIGVCFGHQIVGRALSVPVDRNPKGWEVSVHELKLSDEGKKLFGLETLEKKLHQMHRDYVFSYPAGAIPLAESPLCEVQGMLIPDRVITVQGHPEFTEGIVREILTARRAGKILSEETYQDGMDRVANEHDGVRVAQAFVKFMKGGSE